MGMVGDQHEPMPRAEGHGKSRSQAEWDCAVSVDYIEVVMEVDCSSRRAVESEFFRGLPHDGYGHFCKWACHCCLTNQGVGFDYSWSMDNLRVWMETNIVHVSAKEEHCFEFHEC